MQIFLPAHEWLYSETSDRDFLHGLDLFSGYGGLTLGLQRYVRPLAYCEIDRYAQGILLSRIQEGLLPAGPIWDDIETFDPKPWKGFIDIVYGGFPCQDISIAGAGKGLEGKRSGLFFRLCEVVEEVDPSYLFLENVPAIRTRGLRTVIRRLTDMGYDCRWTCVSAAEVGAPHLRKRWFLLGKRREALADSDSQSIRDIKQRLPRGRAEGIQDEGQAVFRDDGEAESMAHTSGDDARSGKPKLQKNALGESTKTKKEWRGCQRKSSRNGSTMSWKAADSWAFEPNVGRVVNGCALRVDRIKALGNGVVPAQAREAFERLIGKQREN